MAYTTTQDLSAYTNASESELYILQLFTRYLDFWDEEADNTLQYYLGSNDIFYFDYDFFAETGDSIDDYDALYAYIAWGDFYNTTVTGWENYLNFLGYSGNPDAAFLYELTPVYYSNGSWYEATEFYAVNADAEFAYSEQMQSIMDMAGTFTNLNFEQSLDAASAQTDADLLFYTAENLNYGELEGYTNFPGQTDREDSTDPNDFWSLGGFTSDYYVMNAAPELGGGEYLNWTLIHELGHGLGLAHSFDDDPNDNMPYDLGNLDNERYSVMSYTAASDAAAYGHAVTFMALDIAALQSQYGASDYATGDSSYGLLDAQGGALDMTEGATEIGQAYFCIWDSAGVDEISYAGLSNSVLINLNDATLDVDEASLASYDQDLIDTINLVVACDYFAALSSDQQTWLEDYSYNAGGFFSQVLVGDVSSGFTALDGGYSIANGVVIENAVGGDNDDMLIGNEYDNMLTGGAGNDVLFGGAGSDTAIFSGAIGDFVILDMGDSYALYNFLSDELDYAYQMENFSFGDGAMTKAELDEYIANMSVNSTEQSYGTNSADTISLASEGAQFTSNMGDDVVTGGTGNDRIQVFSGQNQLNGGDGQDYLTGGIQGDQISGGAGVDIIIGDMSQILGGSDRIEGGTGDV